MNTAWHDRAGEHLNVDWIGSPDSEMLSQYTDDKKPAVWETKGKKIQVEKQFMRAPQISMSLACSRRKVVQRMAG